MSDETKKKLFNNKIISYGLIALIISTAVFISYFFIRDLGVIVNYIMEFANKLISVLAPLIIATILSYLFNKPVMFFERFLGKMKGKRALSIGILYILIFGVIASILNFIVPKVQQSLIQLMYSDLPRYSVVISSNLQQSMEWLKSLDFSIDYNSIQNYVSRFTNISAVVLDGVMSFAKSLTQGIFNFVLAMILTFYILLNKEKLLSAIKELIYLYGGEKIRHSVFAEAREIDSVLNGYITGMLIDALNVSILSMIGLRLIGHNYFFLMGIAMGILNLIPYFGALIGCFIASLIALFQGVPKALYTLVLLILILQFDANVIQPRIVGNKVGLEPLWVISALLVFGSYWGIAGMIIAVPSTALIKAILKRVIEKRRTKVNCKTDKNPM